MQGFFPPWNVHSPKLTAKATENRPYQKETHLSTLVFQVRTVSFREISFHYIWLVHKDPLKMAYSNLIPSIILYKWTSSFTRRIGLI